MNKYNITKNDKGEDVCYFVFIWTDEQGIEHTVHTDDTDTAKNTIDLLCGEITLSDLLP